MQTSMSIRGSQTSMSMRGSQTSMSMRGSLNEQLARLQGKHNAELELIEDMRQFSRQRSIMEKQYSDVSLGGSVRVSVCLCVCGWRGRGE